MVEQVQMGNPTPTENPAAMPAGQAIPADAPDPSSLTPTGPKGDTAGAPPKAPEGTPTKFLNADGSLNQDAVVKSYQALESMQGQSAAGEASPKTDPSTGAADKAAVSPEGEPPAATESGPVSYGTAVDNIISAAGLTPDAVNKEYQETGGISEDTLGKLEAVGFSKDVVQSYVNGMIAQAQAGDTEAAAAEQQVKEVFASVGGEEEYSKIATWAQGNMTEAEIAAYDGILESGSKEAIDMAVAGLKARFEQAEGKAPTLIQGGASGGVADVFHSAVEMADAMKAARATFDPAKIKAVEEKALRSNVF